VKTALRGNLEGITGRDQRVFSSTSRGRSFKDFDVGSRQEGLCAPTLRRSPSSNRRQISHLHSQVETPKSAAVEIIPEGGGTSTGTLVCARMNTATGRYRDTGGKLIGRRRSAFRSTTFVLKQIRWRPNLTGKASADVTVKKHEPSLKEGKIDGDSVSFVEMFSFQGNDLRIVLHRQTVLANEIKLARQVGEFRQRNLWPNVEAEVLRGTPRQLTSAGPGDNTMRWRTWRVR